MSVWMLRDVIWIRFFTKPVCWQNSVVIFENSYIPHMTFFLVEIWSVDRTLSQKSKNIKFAPIGCLQLHIFNFEWTKVNTGRMRDLTLKAAISMLFLILFFFPYISRKVWMLTFLCHWNHFILTFKTHALHITLIEHQICQLPSIYSFLHFSSKSAFKT